MIDPDKLRRLRDYYNTHDTSEELAEALENERCEDVNDDDETRIFMLWAAFCAFLGLATLGFFGWMVYELVTWVTSK